jgi:hypothetical protein
VSVIQLTSVRLLEFHEFLEVLEDLRIRKVKLNQKISLTLDVAVNL